MGWTSTLKYRESTVLVNAYYNISFISLYILFLLSHGLFCLVVLSLVALCQAVSQKEGERENGSDRREKKKHPYAPTASTLGPNPYYYPN